MDSVDKAVAAACGLLHIEPDAGALHQWVATATLGQRAMLALRLGPTLDKETTYCVLKCRRSEVSTARHIVAAGDEDIVTAIECGALTMYAGKKLLALPPSVRAERLSIAVDRMAKGGRLPPHTLQKPLLPRRNLQAPTKVLNRFVDALFHAATTLDEYVASIEHCPSDETGQWAEQLRKVAIVAVRVRYLIQNPPQEEKK